MAIQDTTALDWTTHPATSGLGNLAHRRKLGLLAHSVLAAEVDGVPLGLLHQHVWARDPDGLGRRELRNKVPTAEQESRRWIDAWKATEAALPHETIVVAVADREADFCDLFATERRDGSHLLIRAKPRRRVRHTENLLVRALRVEPARGAFTVAIPRGPGRPARVATLTVRFAAVALAPPLNRRLGDRLLAGSYTDPYNARLAKRLRKHRAALFTFLTRDGVDATNNLAEREVRPAVIARKLSAGNRTDAGPLRPGPGRLRLFSAPPRHADAVVPRPGAAPCPTTRPTAWPR